MAQVFGLRIQNLDGLSCFLAVNLHILSKIPLLLLADRLTQGDYLLLKVLRDLREGRGIDKGDLAALRTSLYGNFVPNSALRRRVIPLPHPAARTAGRGCGSGQDRDCCAVAHWWRGRGNAGGPTRTDQGAQPFGRW